MARSNSSLAATVIFSTLMVAADVQCAVITLTPTIDGTKVSLPGPPFSLVDTTDQSLRVEFSYSGLGSVSQSTAAMTFDLSMIPNSASIVAATLNWTPRYAYGTGSMTIDDYTTSSPTNLHFNGLSPAASVPLSATSLNVTTFAQANHYLGNDYLGFHFIAQPSDFPDISVSINSRLASDPALRPMLVIQTVPEASSVIFVAIATLVGFLVRMRVIRTSNVRGNH